MDFLNSMMGGGDADNEETEHTSGVERLCGSLVCAFCLAPLCILGAMFLLGWNEQQSVCNTRKIAAGLEVVKENGCTDKGENSGELVMFSCDIQSDSLPLVSSFGLLTGTDFSNSFNGVKGPGLRVSSQMYQCVEREESKTKKDSVGGGKTTTKTYLYSKEWRSDYVDTGSFHKRDSDNFRQNCGVENPRWPSAVPESGSSYASEVEVGAFTVPSSYVRRIDLNTPLSTVTTPGTGNWFLSGGEYESRQWATQGGAGDQIGTVKVSFYGYDAANPMQTALGENKDGKISSWVAPESWLCTGTWRLEDMRAGKKTKEELFDELQAEQDAFTWILRFVAFIVMWGACCGLAKPLEVAADCVPCIGPFLGDSVSCVIACVSCLPATMCTVGVAGIVWVAMRPMVGGPLIAVFLVILCSLVGYKVYAKQSKGEE